MRVSVFVAASLDGFIARKDGKTDWLNEANATVPDGEDCGFQAFFDTVDTLIMGRKTYEQVLSFGQWAYGRTPVVVLSRNPIRFAADTPDTVTHSSTPPRRLIGELSDKGVKHIYVDGGATIQGFLSEGIVDEMIITTIPVALGSGIPLFSPMEKDIKMERLNTKVYDCGFVRTTYKVLKNS